MKQRCKEVTKAGCGRARFLAFMRVAGLEYRAARVYTPPHYTHECENKRVAKWAMRK